MLATAAGERLINVPAIRHAGWCRNVPPGYFAAPEMDLIDLFVGSEGTLGVIVEAELQHRPRPAGVCWLFIALADRGGGDCPHG